MLQFWKAAIGIGGISAIALFVFNDILVRVVERNQSTVITILVLLFLFLIVNKALDIHQPKKKEEEEKVKPPETVNQTPTTCFEPFGRKTEINRLKGLILTGQSATIVGVFETERTTLLGYLSNPSHSHTLYGEHADKLVFSRLDIPADLLPKENCSPTNFWQLALRPLEDQCRESPTLLKLYQSCSQNQFDEYCLDKLMVQLGQEGWRLVLMLDRFDELLRSPKFKKNAKFFATLRKLASSHSPSSLCLIVSWGLSLKEFHKEIRNFNKGSPYFNFMSEVMLGASSNSETDKLLMDFSELERRFLKDLAGCHPYFLQQAVSALQTAKKQQGETEPLEMARKIFSEGVENILEGILYSWNTKGVCKAIVSLVKEGKAPELSNDELSLLEKQGFLVKNRDNQWQVSPPVLVYFINKRTEQELCNC